MLQISVQLCLRLHISTINKTPIYLNRQMPQSPSAGRIPNVAKVCFEFYSIWPCIFFYFQCIAPIQEKKNQKSLDNIGEKQRKEQQQTVL